jgi:hypothetical protein
MSSSAAVTPPKAFYTGMALLSLFIVFAGFARTYYLKAFTTSPQLSSLLHVHGILFTAWIILFLAQTALIAAHRRDVHKRLGVLGGVLAATMIVVGTMTAIDSARQNRSGLPFLDNLGFLAIPLGDLVIFLGLLIVGFRFRRRPEIHRRAMLLATQCLLTAPIGRLPIIGGGALVPVFFAVVVLAGPVYERLTLGRFQLAYLLAAIGIWVSFPLRLALGSTSIWQRFAGWLVG